MCYASGSMHKYNVFEKVLGADQYRKIDPVASAVNRDVDKRFTQWFDAGAPAQKEMAARDARIEASNTLLAGRTMPPVPQPRKPTGAGVIPNAAVGQSLLGG